MEKTVEYYLGLPYTIEMIPEPAGGWFVAVRELPGCMSEGDTPEEAVQMIRDAMRGWIKVALEDGDMIPEPRDLDDYSGKFVVRVPKSLHRALVEQAAEEGVSLNQYVNLALGWATGRFGSPTEMGGRSRRSITLAGRPEAAEITRPASPPSAANARPTSAAAAFAAKAGPP